MLVYTPSAVSPVLTCFYVVILLRCLLFPALVFRLLFMQRVRSEVFWDLLFVFVTVEIL